MKWFKIVILPIDGIGSELIESALSVLDIISRKYNFEIDLIYEISGGKSYV
jgi:isocitrate/isopropylmalate dehydrogenase